MGDARMPMDLKRVRALARALYRPAKILATVGALGCLAVAGFGQLGCAEHALIRDTRARDYIVAPIACLFVLGMLRMMGHAGREKLREMRESFDAYGFPFIEVGSIRITYVMFVFLSVMLCLLTLLCVPVGIAFINLGSIGIQCATSA